MLNMGSAEIMVVVAVVIIFIGPKGIPKLVKDIRGWIKSLRQMVGELTSTFDDMVKDTDFKETADLLKEARSFNPRKQLSSWIDPDGETEKSLQSLNKEVKSATSASSELSSPSFSSSQSAKTASTSSASTSTASTGTASTGTASASPASSSTNSAAEPPKRPNALLEEASSHLDSLKDKDSL